MNADLKQSKLHLLSACNVLIAANIAVMAFAAMKNPDMLWFPHRQTLIDLGANYGVLTLSGESWRLVTSMFLHVGIVHLALNIWALRCVGPTAESLFGWRMFVLIYFFAGVIGSLTSVFHDPLNVSAGASGALLGLFGSLLAFLYVQRDKYPRGTLRYYTALASGLFLAMLICGFFEPGIDHFAHLGGFVAGGIAGLILARLDIAEGLRVAYAVPVMLLMIILLCFVTGDKFKRGGFADYAAGVRALRDNHYEQAISLLSQFIAHDQTEAQAFGLRAIAYLKTNQLALAVDDYDKMVELSPHTAGAFNDRAWAECGLGKYDRAIDDATTSLKLDPKSAATYDTRGYAYAHTGQAEKALADFENGLKYAPGDLACRYHRMKLYESLGKTADADRDRPVASAYHPEIWER